MSSAEQTPVTVAEAAAVEFFERFHTDEHATEAEELLAEVNRQAQMNGFIGAAYLLSARRGLSIPLDYESEEKAHAIDLREFSLFGVFADYSHLTIDGDSEDDPDALRALCMTFMDPLVITSSPELSGHLLYVPVLSTTAIDRLA